MEFFNPVQKVGWTAGQPLIQVKNEGGVNQQFDFTPLANQLANQQAAASNFHNIVGAAQFPIGSFAGAQAAPQHLHEAGQSPVMCEIVLMMRIMCNKNLSNVMVVLPRGTS